MKYDKAKMQRIIPQKMPTYAFFQQPIHSTITIKADQVLEGISTNNAKKLCKEGLCKEAWQAYQTLNYPQWEIIALRKIG